MSTTITLSCCRSILGLLLLVGAVPLEQFRFVWQWHGSRAPGLAFFAASALGQKLSLDGVSHVLALQGLAAVAFCCICCSPSSVVTLWGSYLGCKDDAGGPGFALWHGARFEKKNSAPAAAPLRNWAPAATWMALSPQCRACFRSRLCKGIQSFQSASSKVRQIVAGTDHEGFGRLERRESVAGESSNSWQGQTTTAFGG